MRFGTQESWTLKLAAFRLIAFLRENGWLPLRAPLVAWVAPFASLCVASWACVTWLSVAPLNVACLIVVALIVVALRAAAAPVEEDRRQSRTWNTLWSTPPSSRSTATDRAQRGTQNQAIGRSKGGMTTKILALTDALGNLVRFELLPGQRFDTVGVPPLIKGVSFDALIADKAFDSNAIIADPNRPWTGCQFPANDADI